MKNKFFIAVLVFLCLYPLGAIAQSGNKTNASNSIIFKGAKCQITDVTLDPNFTPVGMKEEERAIVVHFAYTLDAGLDMKSLSVLYDEGSVVSPDGEKYKPGAALSTSEKYSILYAVPKTLDVSTLSFVLKDKKIQLNPFIKK